MSRARASIFDSEDAATDDLDLSGFKPKADSEPAAPAREEVRAIAEASNFPSREAKPRVTATLPAAAATHEPAVIRRQPRRHRTGRTAQFNVRTTPDTVEAFYAIADQERWLIGETLERALDALQRELKAAK